MAHLAVNGLDLYYEIHGDGEPLLCVMGLAADTQSWLLQLGQFSERHRTVIFDNRDVGRSSYAMGPYEVADMAADALGLADGLGLERFHLLGVSMGGAIAQEVALAAPQRVRTLTLAVTYAGGGAWAREKSRLWRAQASRCSRQSHVDTLLLHTLSEAFYEDPEAVAYARRLMLANPHPQRPEGFARQLDASGRHEARDRVGALPMPVHVIGAEYDVLVPVWKARELAGLISQARLTVIPGAPHGVQVERALEFNGAVLDFLATVGEPRSPDEPVSSR